MHTLSTQSSLPRHSERAPRPLVRGARLLVWLLVIALVIVAYNSLLWPWMSRWGATEAEVEGSLPGDEVIQHPLVTTTKAVTVQAGPDQIWPWILQLGVDRGGMYSYLWVENWLLRLNVTNADTINPTWQKLAVGDFIRFTPQDFALNPGPGLYVREIQPRRALVGCFGMENQAVDCDHAATWQFVLEPISPTSTRLILRSRTAGTPSTTTLLGAKVGGAFQFYMERKMLLTLKTRAESWVALP